MFPAAVWIKLPGVWSSLPPFNKMLPLPRWIVGVDMEKLLTPA